MAVNLDQQRRVQLQGRPVKFDFEANRRKLEEQRAAAMAASTSASTSDFGSSFSTFPTKEPETVKKSFMEKILAYTGGNKIGQGLGQALAMAGTKQTLDDIQKGEGEMQQKLMQAIRKNKAEGKDTTKLVSALNALTGSIKETGEGAEDLLNPNKLTTKQVLGDALQLGTTIVGAGTLPSAAKNVVGATGIKAGLIQGAKIGAKSGAGFGALTGASQGLKQDKNTADILKQGAVGAVGGAITGGLVGGVIGGVSGGLAKRSLDKISGSGKRPVYLEAITPKTTELSTKEYGKLLRDGKITPKTATSPAAYVLSPEEIAIATKHKGLFGKDPVNNLLQVSSEIGKQDKKVGEFLAKNNGIFNSSQLKKHLMTKLDDIDDVMVDKNRLKVANEELVDNFIASMKKKDMKSLWQARKTFDFKSNAFSGSPTLSKTVQRELRNSVQDFITQKTPNNTYQESMKEMTQLMKILDVLETKAGKEKAYSQIGKLLKDKPYLKETLKWVIPSVGVGFLGSQIVD